MKALPFYDCPHCGEGVVHPETTKENRLPVQLDKCSARYRQKDSGGWRSCHAPFALFGGPHRLGPSALCQACWDRQMFGPALAALAPDDRKAARGVARAITADELVGMLPKELQDLHNKTKGSP